MAEDLAPLFQENKDRPYLYWANLDWYKKTKAIQKNINLPINQRTFMSVRKNLYSNEKHFDVNIDTLDIPYLWANGFHDFVMDGASSILMNNSKTTPFYQSAHYPHIEANERFCDLNNQNAYYFIARDGIPLSAPNLNSFLSLGRVREEIPRVWAGYIMNSNNYIVVGHCYYAEGMNQTFATNLQDFPTYACNKFAASIKVYS